MAGFRRYCLVGLVAVLCLPSCNSAATTLSEPEGTLSQPEASGNVTSARPPSGTDGSSSPTIGSTGSTAGTAPPARRPRLIKWILSLGVAGGVDVPPELVVAHLSRGDCRQAQQVVEDSSLPALYNGAVAACLAALNGQEQLWAEAAAVLDRRPAVRNCFDRAVQELLHRLVSAHRQDPEARLRPAPAEPGETLACPRFTAVTPRHGPVAGGFLLRFVGVHLPARFVVHFSWSFDAEIRDQRVRATSMNGTEAVAVAPPLPAGADRTVIIYPEGWPLEVLSAIDFRYDAAPGKTAPSSHSPTTAPPRPSSPPSTLSPPTAPSTPSPT